ncbi:MAG: DUF1573 domain-containing protein [Planctomycetaceae bacterium]|nr:DUF1573 domain-containing protein [Planctomycetaceae bacterium]
MAPLIEGEVDVIRHSFDVRNPYSVPLNVTSVEKTCSCTSTALAFDSIKPRSSEPLLVTADIKGRTGAFSAVAILKHDHGESWRYEISVLIHPRLAVEPMSLYLGPLVPGERVDRCVTVTQYARNSAPPVPALLCAGDSPSIALDRINSSVDHLVGELHRRHTVFNVSFTVPSDPGAHRCSLTVRPDPRGVSMPGVPLQWVVESPYVTTPERLVLTSVAAGAETQFIAIRRLDRRPFRVNSVSSPDTRVACQITTAGAAAEHMVSVTLDSSYAGRFLATKIAIVLDDPEWSCLSVPLVASH